MITTQTGQKKKNFKLKNKLDEIKFFLNFKFYKLKLKFIGHYFILFC